MVSKPPYGSVVIQLSHQSNCPHFYTGFPKQELRRPGLQIMSLLHKYLRDAIQPNSGDQVQFALLLGRHGPVGTSDPAGQAPPRNPVAIRGHTAHKTPTGAPTRTIEIR